MLSSCHRAINVYLHLRVIKSCLIWTSLCMLPFEVVTIDLHYMTDRQERFDLKIKIETSAETNTNILDALEVR